MPLPRRHLVRALSALAGMAVASTLLSGCVPLPDLPARGTHSATGHAGEKVAAELERFYGQSPVWRSAGGGIDSTTVKVPLDWSDPTGATIELALARHRASGERLGSLLVNPGGPGGSGS